MAGKANKFNVSNFGKVCKTKIDQLHYELHHGNNIQVGQSLHKQRGGHNNGYFSGEDLNSMTKKSIDLKSKDKVPNQH